MEITINKFSNSTKNDNILLYSLSNDNGVELKISNYGGIITSWLLPEKDNKKVDIVLGFNSFEEYRDDFYLKNCPYLGAIVGRYANRIGNATFKIDNTKFNLAKNNGINHLHGGIEGFDKKIWNAQTCKNDNEVCLSLSYLSADGEENYPGNLNVQVDYILNNDNELIVKYSAETDQTTCINLTQHSYFNLKGEGNGNILDHLIQINADRYTKTDENLIPTGEMPNLNHETLNLKTEKLIGENIDKVGGNGYDHNYVLNKTYDELSFAARVFEPMSKRELKVYTTKPGIQFYTGNFLDGHLTGKSGNKYQKNAGFCLETQFFPDSPNKKEFPTPFLKVGEKYEHITIFKMIF